MIKSTENFNFSETILNTTKLGLITLSANNLLFNVNRMNNQFLYASTVLDDAFAEPFISNNNTDSNITSVLNYNYKGMPLLYSTITPGAYNLIEIAELIKEETGGNVIIEPDKNTMKCIMEIRQGALSFDVENSTASLLGFRKKFYNQAKANIHLKILLMLWVLVPLTTIVMLYLVLKIMVIMVIDILYTFTPQEPLGYLINIIPTNILYQNVTKYRIDYIDFHIKDEHGRPIDFNGDV